MRYWTYIIYFHKFQIFHSVNRFRSRFVVTVVLLFLYRSRYHSVTFAFSFRSHPVPVFDRPCSCRPSSWPFPLFYFLRNNLVIFKFLLISFKIFVNVFFRILTSKYGLKMERCVYKGKFDESPLILFLKFKKYIFLLKYLFIIK